MRFKNTVREKKDYLVAKWSGASPTFRSSVFLVMVGIGVQLRLVFATLGYNADMESYRIVADVMAHGDNVYKETCRYNYGPLWFWLLHWLDQLPKLALSTIWDLRFKVVILLTVVDIGIMGMLRYRYGRQVALLFFLNPISIFITGFHSQFDNIAVLMGLGAVLIADGDQKDAFGWRRLACLALLGCSLITKHLLFMFPLWLAMRERRLILKVTALVLPLVIFAAGFVPYWEQGRDGIINNVFLYRSYDNAPFWIGYTPQVLWLYLPKIALFLISLFIFGLVFRQRPVVELFFLHLLILVIFSSAIANQYLAICIVAIALWFNWAFFLYSLYGIVFLAGHVHGLKAAWARDLLSDKTIINYIILVGLLFVGFAWHLAGPRIIETASRLVRYIRQEIRFQLLGK